MVVCLGVLGCLLGGIFGFLGCKPEKKPDASSDLRVLVTLKPIHSLVASLMVGRGRPELLLEGHASPHSMTLKPSHKNSLQQAHLVVWVGPSFEGFLKKPVMALPPERVITLLNAPGMVLLSQECHHCDRSADDKANDHHIDGHIWLDPQNALTIARCVMKKLVALDPEHRSLYRKNFDALRLQLRALDAEMKEMLAPYKDKAFFVVHAAYGYFVKRYDLQTPSSILSTQEDLLSPQNLLELSAFLKTHQGGCVFFEPQFKGIFERLRSFVKMRGGHIGQLDPLGVDDPAGPDQYCLLLRRCANNMVCCFSH